MAKTIEIRVLGELEVMRQGGRLRLPPSRKTRALLAYLVLTERSHLRQHLCDLFWEGPDDPRGALRWSLSQIRKLVDEDGTRRLVADRERVAFEPHGISFDLDPVRQVIVEGVDTASLKNLWAASRCFRGELLEGLELADCYQFHGWCVAEREAARNDRLSILRALLARLDDPQEILAVARQWATVDPLTPDAHAAVIHGLVALGRRNEAQNQYNTCQQLLTEAFGVEPSDALQRLQAVLNKAVVTPIATPKPITPSVASLPDTFAVPFIGREQEVARINDLATAAREGKASPVLLLAGEPGIGKSRLMTELGKRMAVHGEIGGLVLRGRAFEAEMVRPFGPWVEAFRSIPQSSIPQNLLPDLSPLFPAFSPQGYLEPDRNRLFGAVTQLLATLAAGQPVALLLDDLHWFDTVSLSLLHFVARSMDSYGRLVIACTVRPEELIDNPDARRVLRSLSKERCLREVQLSPLDEAETALLVGEVADGVDADRVHQMSEGNPFVAMEVALALGRGNTALPERVEDLIADRLAHAGPHAQGVLPWAAAIGARFGPEVLERATGQAGGVLAEALAELEARGILLVTETGDYDFSHDLLRRMVYRGISEPRRRILHRQIARTLDALSGETRNFVTDVVHHAELAGDHDLIARSCVAAAEYSLRLFAVREAMGLANQGLAHVAHLLESVRMDVCMALLRLRTLAISSAGMAHSSDSEEQLLQAIREAERLEARKAESIGHYLLSVIHEDRGETKQAGADTLRAAAVGRDTDTATMARQLANTARCLLQLEQDVGRARYLLHESDDLCRHVGIPEVELSWGFGLLAHWDGDGSGAVDQLRRALDQARGKKDRWRECNCLAWLALIEFENGHGDEVRHYCGQLQTVASKMGEGAKGTHADALLALIDHGEGIGDAGTRLNQVLGQLRAEDNKALLAYTLNASAGQALNQDRPDRAQQFAEEALVVASAVKRPSEVVLAHITLASIFQNMGEQDTARTHATAAQTIADGADAVSKRARLAISACRVYGDGQIQSKDKGQ